MIDRIVLFKLKAEFVAERETIASHAHEVLASLPMVEDVRVGVPADEATLGSWDLSLVVRFADLAAVHVYNGDPTHRALVDDYLLPRVEVRKAWNFSAS